ncbi:MAG: hypothetical protein JW854_02460 [Actinobacteria bacterium]|nr:hypothetical protein [Actinomycetota bacterium]
MEAWAYRVRRARIALTLLGIVLIAGSLTAVIWLLVILAARQDAAHRVTILVLALLPLPYLLVYLLGMKKGYSPLRRYRLRRRMRGVGPLEHPHRKAAEIWGWLPFHRHGFYATSAAPLAEEKDPAWLELAEANHAAMTATGSGFDVLVVLKKGPINALAGELPGVGTWFCVSREVVESLHGEGLMAALIHELFHAETGELKARNIAMDLHDLGVFALSFVVYYLCVGLVLSSVPADWALTELPLLSLLVLLLWVVIKLYSRMAERFLFPEGSCRAADEYASHVISGPVKVAEAFLSSLRYSVEQAGARHALSSSARYVYGFMFAPLTSSRRRAGRQIRRIEALRMRPGADGTVPLRIEEMNHRIEGIAEEAGELYARQRSQPSGRLAAALAYTALFVTIAVVLGIGTGKNFLPVRLFLDWTQGGPNTAVEAPGAAANTVTIYGSGGDGAGGYLYLSPGYLTVTVEETVTWVNEDAREHIIEGDGIPRSPVLGPGGEYSVRINRSGRFSYRILDGSGGEVGLEGEIFAYY